MPNERSLGMGSAHFMVQCSVCRAYDRSENKFAYETHDQTNR